MRIVHVNFSDIVGGAARAAYRLHSGLRRLGHDSVMFVRHKYSKDDHVVSFKQPPNNLNRRIYKFFCRNVIRYRRRLGLDFSIFDLKHTYIPSRNGYELFSGVCREYGKAILAQLPESDIINLHWIAQFVDYQTFFGLMSQRRPIVWTLHDMNALTGGCHYDLGCGRSEYGCGACPQLSSQDLNDVSRKIWLMKRKIYKRIDRKRLRIVTPSNWLANESRKSGLLNRFDISVIPNGLNTKEFAPRNKNDMRRRLGIPVESKVILFVAQDLSFRRKGFYLLKDVLSMVDGLGYIWLLSIGKGNPSIDGITKHIHFGTFENDSLLSNIYSVSDLFIIPSIQDNLPNTVMEAHACGIPVVGFDVGGISDMVQDGVTGCLVPQEDLDALCAAVKKLLDDEKALKRMSANCRILALREYDLRVQAQRYLSLYEEMVR